MGGMNTSSQGKIVDCGASYKEFFNKKGATFQFWVEVVIFLGAFLFILGVIALDMNQKYGKNNDLTLGLNLSTNIDSLQDYQSDLINSTTEGQTSVTDYGILKLTTVPSILLSVTRILWNFVSGGFIYALVMNMQLGAYGTYIAGIFQTLYVIAIAFLLIKLVLRSPI